MGHFMAVEKGQQKRFWPDDEKRSICAQTRAPGVSVAQVALRDAMSANLFHKWLRDPRFSPDVEDVPPQDQGGTFLPIEVALSKQMPLQSDVQFSTTALAGPMSARRVDITLSDGRRILVEGTTALSAVLALVKGLAL